jgi:hypothetical protein
MSMLGPADKASLVSSLLANATRDEVDKHVGTLLDDSRRGNLLKFEEDRAAALDKVYVERASAEEAKDVGRIASCNARIKRIEAL